MKHSPFFSALPIGLVAALLISGCSTTRPAEAPAPLAVAPYLGPDQLGMVLVRPGAIAVDGDLSEWHDLPLAYLDPRWDAASGQAQKKAHPDRAVLWLARDDQALYVALRVVDEEAVNPFADSQMWCGDGLEVFLDVRPEGAQGDTAVLGASKYTPGCYQLLFAPVSPEGAPRSRWHCIQEGPGIPRQIDTASRLLRDGYTLEIRIPFAQLDNALPSRFDRPIGFDFIVDDIAGKAPQDLVQCLWTGRVGGFNDAARLGRAVPLAPGARSSPLVRYLPPRYMERGGRPGFISGTVMPLNPDRFRADLSLSFRYAGTPFDRPDDPGDWEVPPDKPGLQPRAKVDRRTRTDRALGLRVVERELRLTDLIGGRYWAFSHLEIPGQVSDDTVRAYYVESKRQGYLEVVDQPVAVEELPQAIASRLVLRAEQYHLFDADTTRVQVGMWGMGGVAWRMSELGQEAQYQMRLELSPAHLPDTLVWSGSRPFRGREVNFAVPLDRLDSGMYLAHTTLVDPQGAAFPLRRGKDEWASTAVFLGVHRGRDQVLPAVLDTATALLTQAVPVGDPNRGRFPTENRLHCFARSLWDLQAYQGRIYTGCGDWGDNQGPIDIWSFGPAAPGDTLVFAHEFTVDEESVDLLVELDGRLAVPGTDSRESWEWGSLYVKEKGAWRKLRTVPNGLHVLGAELLDNRLYVTTGTEKGAALYQSDDGGQTWQRYSTDDEGEFVDGRYHELAVLEGQLLVVSAQGAQYLYRFDGEQLERAPVPLFPGIEAKETALLPWRLIESQGGVYYSHQPWSSEKQPHPLFFLRDMETGGLLVEPLAKAHVQDIIAREDTVYVLTSGPAKKGYEGALYRSTRPEEWTLIGRFATPALARSLEELNGVFYLGLASQSEEANPRSGTICRME